MAYINEEQANLLSNVTIASNDVLLNITGASVARCCIVPFEILPARVNQHVCIIRCSEFLNPVYLNQLLTNTSYQSYVWGIAEAGGGTRQALTKQQIENFTVIMPPLAQQNRFAHFVQQLDKSKFTLQRLLLKNCVKWYLWHYLCTQKGKIRGLICNNDAIC